MDLLRGFALAAMAINHFGLSQSYLHNVSGRSTFLINAAEVFFYISGMTLGVIAVRESLERSLRRLLRRVVVVYLTVLGIGLFFTAVALSSDLVLWGELPALGFAELGGWFNGLLTMQRAPFGADVLVAYVVYLAIAPAALIALARGRAWLLVAAVAAVYLASQFAPATVELPFAAFRDLAANSPLFFGGMLVGWFREDWGRWATAGGTPRRVGRQLADAAVIALSVALAVGHARNFAGIDALSGTIGARVEPTLTTPEGVVTEQREASMPIPSLLVVALYLRFLWVVVDRLWVPLCRATGWFLLPLGQASLFTYTVHLLVMPLFWNLPGFKEDVSRVSATAWVVAYLGVIYAAVRMRAAIRRVALAKPKRAATLRYLPEAAVATLAAATLITGWTFADTRAQEKQREAAVESVVYAAALAEELNELGIDYEWRTDDDGYVEVEIDWDDPRAVEAVEDFEEVWED